MNAATIIGIVCITFSLGAIVAIFILPEREIGIVTAYIFVALGFAIAGIRSILSK